MRLNLYLLRQEVDSFEDALRPRYRNERPGITPLTPSKGLPFRFAAYVQRKEPKPPQWLSFLASHFNLDLQNVSNGFLLLLEASGRLFAASFGSAFHLLDPEALEPDFGIRVCANSLDPRQLKSLDARNVDIVTRQQRVNLSVGRSIEDFGVELDENWVRFLSGSPIDTSIAKSLAGTDSLKINASVTIEGLAAKCSGLLEIFSKADYKESFDFLDQFRALRKGDSRVRELDGIVRERIQERSEERISVALPFFPEAEIDSYKFLGRGVRDCEVEELTLSSLYSFLDEHVDIDDPYKNVKIVAFDEDGGVRSRAYRLKDYVVAEVELGSETFVLTAGNWFLVNRDYARSVRERVAGLRDLTDDLDLAPLQSSENEANYNSRVAADRGWLLFDKKLFYGTGEERHQKIEIADLLASDHRFLCVKKMNSSASLSHLFAQGAVSAELLRYEEAYRRRVVELGGGLVLDENFMEPRPVFIFCIATDKPGRLSESLFLFSAIHLVRQAKQIERRQAEVALAKIDMV